MAKILIVDDEENIAKTLKYNLDREGYEVTTCDNGLKAVELARNEKPDLIVLDLMLPGMNGLDVCRTIRQSSTVPILILTAREEEVDKILGLELGADDYITKPFSLRELVARIRAMLRRVEMLQPLEKLEKEPLEPGTTPSLASSNPASLTTSPTRPQPASFSPAPPEVIKTGDLQINLAGRAVTLKGKTVTFKPKEFELLVFLIRHQSQVLTRETLLERVWGYDYSGGTRTVDVHVRWLREKIEEDPSKPYYIHTVFGVGYKFDPVREES